MAADTAEKRFSAMHIGSPWRGLNVDPSAASDQGERQAVMFFYSGISFVAPPSTDPGALSTIFITSQEVGKLTPSEDRTKIDAGERDQVRLHKEQV